MPDRPGALPRRHWCGEWRGARFKTRHGRKKLLLSGAREVTAAPGAAGLHAAWKRTTSPASIVQVPLPAGALLTDAGSSSLRRHAASASLVAAAGSSESIDAGCSEERPSGRRQAERRGPRSLSRRYQPHILDPTLGSGPTGGRYFIYRPPPDGRRSAVLPWCPTRPAPWAARSLRRAVQSSAIRFPGPE